MVWVTRLAAAVSGLLALVMLANAVVGQSWQFGVASGAFVVWVIGWILLGLHWRDVNGAAAVVLDGRAALIALVMVAAFVGASLALSTLA